MPSGLIVEVCKIGVVSEHPHADSLEIASVKGWQVVIRKGSFLEGDLATYIPPDAVIPAEHSERWGITQYLSRGRVRCAKLRGEPSFGVLIKPGDDAWVEGQDVAEFYGITKYEPPVTGCAGDAVSEHQLFWRYTSIENMRNFPNVFHESELVVVTEKIHGTNFRVGVVNGERMAGSHKLQRELLSGLRKSMYWLPWEHTGVQELFRDICDDGHTQAVLYGEIYGKGIQSLKYDAAEAPSFSVFDILIDGKFVDHCYLTKMCELYGIQAVPVLYSGQFSLDRVRELSCGLTTLGGKHVREGVVVRPTSERTDLKIGRVILKYVGDDYLFEKGISDTSDE